MAAVVTSPAFNFAEDEADIGDVCPVPGAVVVVVVFNVVVGSAVVVVVTVVGSAVVVVVVVIVFVNVVALLSTSISGELNFDRGCKKFLKERPRGNQGPGVVAISNQGLCVVAISNQGLGVVAIGNHGLAVVANGNHGLTLDDFDQGTRVVNQE